MNTPSFGATFLDISYPVWIREQMRYLTYASAEEIDEYNQGYLRQLPLAINRLHQRLGRFPGLRLDGRLDSLKPLGDWFVDGLIANKEDRHTELPVWWDLQFPPAGTGSDRDGPFTAQQLRLIDEAQAYVASVLINEAPDARWVIYRGEARDYRNGNTLLVIDDPDWPVNPVGALYVAALNVQTGKSVNPDGCTTWLPEC